MKKNITFGSHSLELYSGAHRAVLVTDLKSLPLKLADALEEIEGIYVHSVKRNDYGFGNIEIVHQLSSANLLAEVCDAITRVYDTDTTITNARP